MRAILGSAPVMLVLTLVMGCQGGGGSDGTLKGYDQLRKSVGSTITFKGTVHQGMFGIIIYGPGFDAYSAGNENWSPELMNKTVTVSGTLQKSKVDIPDHPYELHDLRWSDLPKNTQLPKMLFVSSPREMRGS